MSEGMERPDAADRRHGTLSKHQEVIRAMRLLPKRGRHAAGQPLVAFGLPAELVLCLGGLAGHRPGDLGKPPPSASRAPHRDLKCA
jgi:hypothetical protein